MPDRSAKLQKRFAEAVRTEREAKGWSQEKLGFEAGLSRNFVGNVERAEFMPSLETTIKLANGLGMKGADLLARAKL